MQLIEQVSDGVAIVEAHGRIDSVTARDLNEKLLALIDSGSTSIVLDLKNIAYISSAGFRVLVIADRASQRKNGKLALCEISGDVMRMFEIGAFSDLFSIYPTRHDAVAGIRE